MDKASATKATIIAPTPTGDIEEIKKLDCTTAKEITGVWQNPTGCQKAQLHKMTTQLSSYYVLLDNSFLPCHTIWCSFWSVLWAQLRYPLPALCVSESQCFTLIKFLFQLLLPAMGVARTLPLPFRYGSAKYFGLGLPNLYLELTISKLNILLTHYHSHSLVSKHINTSLQQLQLKNGTDTPFTSCSYDKYGLLATDGWLKSLW